ncbi:MAG: NADH-quinone oxidoreductase subunit N [Verrucomicrobia bacterium]|nr:NADH-quinone oxidoreductase subunit N [Verrucomicrobiota bacterium]
MNLFELLKAVAPELIVTAGAFLVLLVDLAFMRGHEIKRRLAVSGGVACLACLAAIVWISQSSGTANLPMLSLTPLTQLIKQVLIGLTIFTIIVSLNAKFTTHVGEYFAILLLAAVGLMLLVSSENLLMIFVALELVSLSLYALSAFNKASLASAEAALKYFFFGGMSAAFTLFGISLIYGLTGHTELGAIAAAMKAQSVEPVFYVALVMTLIGFAFKIAAAPLHLWVPDTYYAAPTPIAAFIASGSKVGCFFVLARILIQGFESNHGSAAWQQFVSGWMPVIAVLALASMLLGNIAAIAQTSVKRILAYSAIAQAGYALLALFAHEQRAMASLLYFVITYAITVLGSLAVVSIVENSGSRDRLTDFAGLSRRAPVLSGCMLIFILSLAGIPPLAGFFGKFYVFTSAAGAAKDLGMLWLVIAAVGASAISLYYYLQILKQIYVADAPVSPTAIQTPVFAGIGIVVLAAAVVVLGCAPDLLLDKILAAINSVG